MSIQKRAGKHKSMKACKVNMGKWVWCEDKQCPSWDTIRKAPIWSGDEWEYFRIIMAKHVVCPNLITCAEDNERTLTLGEGDMVGKRVAQNFGALNCTMVCKAHKPSIE